MKFRPAQEVSSNLHGNVQIEKRKLEQENAELKSKLERLQLSFKNGETERENFFDGASWAARQCVQACDKGVDQSNRLRLRLMQMKVDSILK